MHYLTISEYKDLFKISRPTIYKRIKEGKLTYQATETGTKIILVEDTEYEKVKALSAVSL